MRICIVGSAKYFDIYILDMNSQPVEIVPATHAFPFDSFVVPGQSRVLFVVTLNSKFLMKSKDIIRTNSYLENHVLICNYAWGRFAENKRVVLRLSLNKLDFGVHRGVTEQYHLEERIFVFLSAFYSFWNDLANSDDDSASESSSLATQIQDTFEVVVSFHGSHLSDVSRILSREKTRSLSNLALRHCMLEFSLQLIVESLVHSIARMQNDQTPYRLVALLFGVALRHDLFASALNSQRFKPMPRIREYMEKWLSHLEFVLSSVPHDDPSFRNLRKLQAHFRKRVKSFD